MDIIKKCMSVCGTIKGWFEPFFWVLASLSARMGASDRALANPSRIASNGSGSIP
jgi:hypothetical protein